MRTAGWLLGTRAARHRPRPDAVVASGLMDLAHARLAAGLDVPWGLYLHENQLSYPRAPGEPLDRGFATAHLSSVLAADAIAFNSRHHRGAMRDAMAAFLDEMPAPRPRGVLARLRRAAVLHPGLATDALPALRPRPAGDPPVVLWNHRWEEDKRPGAFARIMLRLADQGVAFRLVLLGTTCQVRPRARELLVERLGERVLRAAPAPSGAAYRGWLARSDVVVSTAAQENFGYAMLEAMACGAVPVAPARLAYPEVLGPALAREGLLVRTDRDLERRLAGLLRHPERIAALRPRAMRRARVFSWDRQASRLDAWAERLARGRRGRSR
ncbi:MAG: DUF3524 domain-containing protein [Acidobacteria bacterium]|nr:MAG: DUF3524 domain-containing protein [Acidobacteriota bacterium]